MTSTQVIDNDDGPVPADVESYRRLFVSYSIGRLRFLNAVVAHHALGISLVKFRTLPADVSKSLKDGAAKEVFEELSRIDSESYDAHSYVSETSSLVYATSLLDTFLTDTTTFLLLRYPHALGKTQAVSVETLIKAKSPKQLLVEAATRKAREVSYSSFTDRLTYLEKVFGLKLNLKDGVLQALEHYPTVRNTAIHDQGIFELTLDDNGSIQAHQKTCSRHPRPISSKDVSNASAAYKEVAHTVAAAVFGHCLNVPNDRLLLSLTVKGNHLPTAGEPQKGTPPPVGDDEQKG